MNEKQILAVWGSPSSGKTILSLKLANVLSQRKKDVILLLCDQFVPSIPVVLPFLDADNKSLGNILAASEITQEKILKEGLTL